MPASAAHIGVGDGGGEEDGKAGGADALAVGEDTDFASEPQLFQAFPVVAPMSHLRLGPQDVHPPHVSHPKLLEQEDADEVWRFRRERAQAALLYEQRRTATCRRAAETAERAAEAAAKCASDRGVDLEWSRMDRVRRGCESTQALSKRLQDTQEAHRVVDEDCRRRLEEAKALLAIEREATAALEEMLEQERRRNKENECRVEELEGGAQRRVEQRRDIVEKQCADASVRILEAHSVADRRIREAQERAEHGVRMLREQQLAPLRERCQENVTLEVRRNQALASEADLRLQSAGERLGVEELCMRQCTALIKDDCKAHVRRAFQREERTDAFVREWKSGAVAQVFSRAAGQSQAAHRREFLSKTSLEQAAHVLGSHYKTQRQYNLAADNKLSGILGGALHDAAAEVGAPSPSPRSLPLPDSLAGLFD
mmetsp:Transcript_78191/g.203719  ORF Transcript_78191/g.203719 Transcript_78191/m.203719 type:complete len:428 (-) Transcript_78191:78-1361(-)